MKHYHAVNPPQPNKAPVTIRELLLKEFHRELPEVSNTDARAHVRISRLNVLMSALIETLPSHIHDAAAKVFGYEPVNEEDEVRPVLPKVLVLVREGVVVDVLCSLPDAVDVVVYDADEMTKKEKSLPSSRRGNTLNSLYSEMIERVKFHTAEPS